MLAFHLLHYKITVDPLYAVDFLNHIWATEPVGALSVCIAVSSILITVSLKLMDWFWELRRERSRQGKLRIELALQSGALVAVMANVGREPLVVRQVGYMQRRWLGREFVSVQPDAAVLPHALNARELVQVVVSDEAEMLDKLAAGFRVQDSLGKLWEAPEPQVRRVRRQLRQSNRQLARMQTVSLGSADLSEPAEALI